MACEQTILNAAPFIANNAAGRTAAAYVFNILVIARAPMQLYQSVATSLLPHLSKLHAADDFKTYRHSVRITLAAIAGFAGVSALVMAAAGPSLMKLVFGHQYIYDRIGLVAITVGMGVYLCAATLNQTALAAKRTGTAVFCWIGATAFFVAWMALPWIDSPLHRVEIGYPLSSLILFLSLFALYQVATPKAGTIKTAA
jgi:O-antigen/teichoic acid export membrane protein